MQLMMQEKWGGAEEGETAFFLRYDGKIGESDYPIVMLSVFHTLGEAAPPKR
jgi:hypothetical protein